MRSSVISHQRDQLGDKWSARRYGRSDNAVRGWRRETDPTRVRSQSHRVAQWRWPQSVSTTADRKDLRRPQLQHPRCPSSTERVCGVPNRAKAHLSSLHEYLPTHHLRIREPGGSNLGHRDRWRLRSPALQTSTKSHNSGPELARHRSQIFLERSKIVAIGLDRNYPTIRKIREKINTGITHICASINNQVGI